LFCLLHHPFVIAGIKAQKEAGKVHASSVTITAEVAFQLYDTFGFPLDLTAMICKERAWQVDLDGAEKLLNEQRNRGKALAGKNVVHSGIEGRSLFCFCFCFVFQKKTSSPSVF
jgi:alanyl-tRNA synthetase